MKELDPKSELKIIIQRIYEQGLTTMSGGNLSIKNDEGIFVTPAAKDKSDLTENDMMFIDLQGNITGINRLTSEYVVHKAILDMNPGYNAVLHSHPSSLLGFSAARIIPNTKIMVNSVLKIGDRIALAPYAQPGTMDLAIVTANTLKDNIRIAILENHGLFISEVDMIKAYDLLEITDLLTKVQISSKMIALNGALELSNENIKEILNYHIPTYKIFELETNHEIIENAKLLVNLMKRMYKRGLTLSFEGSYSIKLGNNDILITPQNIDILDLTWSDIVVVRDGQISSNQLPSRDVELHLAIYTKNPNIKSVVMASPRFMMTYAVTHQPFISEVIPECYFVLTKVRSVPFGMSTKYYNSLAELFDEEHPTMLIDHDRYIVTANSALIAYDRLEVAEATAEGMITTCLIAPLIPIASSEIEKFNRIKFPSRYK